MDGIEAAWDEIAAEVKANVWGPPEPIGPDAFHVAKFNEHGEVRAGWSHARWTSDRVASWSARAPLSELVLAAA